MLKMTRTEVRVLTKWAALAVMAFAVTPGHAAEPIGSLPDTALGRLGAELVRRLNTDSPEQIRAWAEQAGAAMPADARAEFVKAIVTADKDTGGVNLVSARPGRVAAGSVVMTLRAHRAPRFATAVLVPATGAPDRLGAVFFSTIPDPAIYRDWPKGRVSKAELQSRVHAAVQALVRTAGFSGCVTVLRGGQTVIDECAGIAERNFSVPVDRETRFRIGSMDKMFTATAIAQLVEAGKLKWDSTLAELVPEYPDKDAARSITVWQLLHHQAGLGDIFVPELFQNREKFVNPADYLDLISRQPKVGKPGEQWSYSNAGFVLLGRIVENASGEGYFDYIQRHIFAPAGMTATGYDSREDVVPHLAVGYLQDDVFGLEPAKANWETLPFKASPAGGGYSTNSDLLRFATALRSGRLIRKDTIERMFKDGVPVMAGHTYNAGFDEGIFSGRHVRGHNGGAPGMNADLALVWETGDAVAVTSNTDQPAAQDLGDHIGELLAAQ